MSENDPNGSVVHVSTERDVSGAIVENLYVRFSCAIYVSVFSIFTIIVAFGETASVRTWKVIIPMFQVVVPLLAIILIFAGDAVFNSGATLYVELE